MTTVDVDFSTTVRGGMILAWQDDADGPLTVGARVRACDADEDLAFDAIVREVTEDGRAYLEMLWERVDDFAVGAPAQILPAPGIYMSISGGVRISKAGNTQVGESVRQGTVLANR